MKQLYKICACACFSLLALGMGSCTLSEPDAPKGSADSMRLKSITAAGMNMLKVTYDSSNRIVQIDGSEFKYELTYSNVGNQLLSVTWSEYDEYYDSETEKTHMYLSYVNTWNNIQQNDKGYIVSYDYVETSYNGNSGEVMNTNTGYGTMAYDAEGHLVRVTDTDRDAYGHLDTDVITLTWNNGCLMKDSDGNHYEYSDVPNVNLQWDPFMETTGPLAITGFVGVAPSYFMSKMVEDDYGYIIQTAYTLLDNGLIHQCRQFEDGYSMVATYVYEKY